MPVRTDVYPHVHFKIQSEYINAILQDDNNNKLSNRHFIIFVPYVFIYQSIEDYGTLVIAK